MINHYNDNSLGFLHCGIKVWYLNLLHSHHHHHHLRGHMVRIVDGYDDSDDDCDDEKY